MSKLQVGRVYIFRLKQLVPPSIVDDLIADGLFAELADQWLVVIIDAVGSFDLAHLVLYPALQTLEMNMLDASCTETHVEQGIRLGGGTIEAEPANDLTTRLLREDTLLQKAIRREVADQVTFLHSRQGLSADHVAILETTATVDIGLVADGLKAIAIFVIELHQQIFDGLLIISKSEFLYLQLDPAEFDEAALLKLNLL